MEKWKLFNTGTRKWEQFFEKRSFYFFPVLAIQYDWFRLRTVYIGWGWWLLIYMHAGFKEPLETKRSRFKDATETTPAQ